MRHIKKKIRINDKITKEFTVDEVIKLYDNYIKKSASHFYKYLLSHGGHANYIEFEDLEQIAMIEIAKCYEKYDINYKSEGYNGTDTMGFFPIMDRNVQGAMLRTCRDALRKRRKDYNIHEIGLDYLDAPFANSDGDKEMYLSEVIPSEEDPFEKVNNRLEIDHFMSALTELEKNVVNDLFLNNMTQVNIGLKYDISQVQVSRIQARAIKKMRAMATSENIKAERNVDMKKQSINSISFKNLNDFLISNVGFYETLHHAISDYSRINSFNKKDVYSMLENRIGAYSTIKELYKSNGKAVVEIIEEVKPKEILDTEVKVVDTVNKTVEVTPVLYEEKEEIKEEVKSSANINIFGNLDIESFNMTVNLNSIKAEVTNEGVKLLNIPKGYLNINELVALKESIDKAIEISSTFCK